MPPKPPIPLKKQIWFLLIPVFCVIPFYVFYQINVLRVAVGKPAWATVIVSGAGICAVAAFAIVVTVAVNNLIRYPLDVAGWLCGIELTALIYALASLLTQNYYLGIGWGGSTPAEK